MKRTHKIFLIVLIILLIMVVLFASTFNAVKTQEDIIDMLRQELHLTKDNAIAISYMGEFVIDDNLLLWFSIQNQDMIIYRAVECRAFLGGYHIKNIYTPMTYAQDIVHVVCMANDVFLINNPSCRSIICESKSGNLISKTDILSSDIPYIFLLKPTISESVYDFLDTEGNIIQ